MAKKIKKIKKQKATEIDKARIESIVRGFQFLVKADESNDRTLIVTISTKNPDRSNDEVLPAGMDAANFLANPVVQPYHNYKTAPIAKCIELTSNEDSIIAKVQFIPVGINPEADMIFELYKLGFMNAWSIGFIPTEYSFKNEGGMIISKWELLEFSAVPVPANPEALTLLRSKGFDLVKLGLEKEVEVKEVEIKKDVSQVVSLANIADWLNSYISWFTADGVKQEVIDKMKAALTLLMESIALETTIGEKELDGIAVKEIETKEGKVLSKKNRDLVESCINNAKTMTEGLVALLEASESKEVEVETPAPTQTNENSEVIKFMATIRKSVVDIDQASGSILRDIKKTLEASKSR